MATISQLGQAIEFYRAKKRWTMGQLAMYSGVTASYISKLEKGKLKGEARPSTLEKLAKALEVNVDDLVSFKLNKLAEPKATYSTEEGTRRHQLFQRLNQLTDEQLEALENFLELVLTRGSHEEPQ